MLFADWFSDQVLYFFCGLSIIVWGWTRLFKKFDSNGAIKNTAQKGVVNMVSRWLK